MNWGAYVRLMRLEKPVGILLLWFPAAIALWLANAGAPSISLFCYFLLGTVVMRSAGCIVNDFADRHIDKDVRRTAARPLTTGELGIFQALILFGLLLSVAFYIVIQLPLQCFYFALLGLLITIIYPFCKRWIQAPQLVLSLAFSVSIPMAYAASETSLNNNVIFLLIINMLWVVAYDTMYAMSDREDDVKLGVKSTAILFGQADRIIIGLLQLSMHLLWIPIGLSMRHVHLFYLGWGLGAIVLLYQQFLIHHRNPFACFRAFQWSVAYGGIMWLTLIVSS